MWSASERVRLIERICKATVPNQALYQAEPQPELIAISRTPVVARVPYFAYFAASGKDAYVNGKAFQ
jgi:hypothetical protein